jgi:peroxiredoxin
MGEVKVGDAIPDVDMSELVTGADKPAKINLKDLVAGKKVAIFGVPGAFTPGCSKSHLPSFITAQSDLKAKGVDLTICVATNDAYTMEVSQQNQVPHALRVLSRSFCKPHDCSFAQLLARRGAGRREGPTRGSGSWRTTPGSSPRRWVW